MKKQKGFTLIEIAIVLVIIGLLLGGILKGQELITQGKIKNVISDINGTQAAYYGYQDRYRQLPGDDNLATSRWTSAAGNGNNDGRVAGTYATTTATDESRLFWNHLRLAAFISGTGTEQPRNAAGGIVGVQTGDGAGAAGPGGISALLLCTSALPDKIAIAVDSQLDDGNPASGQVLAVLQTGPGNPAMSSGVTLASPTYQDTGSNLYTLCRTL